MSNTYQLTTLKDVFDKVPPDRIEACLAEVARGMVYAKHLGELAGEPLAWQEPCEWTDDGLTNQTITVQDTLGGDVFTFQAREDA